MKNWDDVKIAPEFNEQGVACYRLTGADFLNEYYIISEAETRKLLNMKYCLELLKYTNVQESMTNTKRVFLLVCTSVSNKHVT